MTNEPRMLHIASDALSADLSTLGAELQNLCDGAGRRLQWDGDPAVWSGRAPILFPIVGMLAGGRYRLDDRTYDMPKHGFARRSTFDVVSHDERSATLRLAADATTRAIYPFEFRLDLDYAIAGATLTAAATIANDGDVPMPASFGFHPAFRWPLPYGAPRDAHAIVFDADEPEPIRRIDADGLLTAGTHATPVVGRTLPLRDEYFDDDALIFDRLRSRSLRYGAAGAPRIAVRFEDFPLLGVWTKPGGARFICIEPWQGVADPEGFAGDLRDKPGIMRLAPGTSRRLAMSIALDSGAVDERGATPAR